MTILSMREPTPTERLVVDLRIAASVDRVRKALSDPARKLSATITAQARPLGGGVACTDGDTVIVDRDFAATAGNDLLDRIVRHEMGHAIVKRHVAEAKRDKPTHSQAPE